MTRFTFFIAAFLLVSLPISAQNSVLRETIYFDSDSFHLTYIYQQKINHIFDSISSSEIQKVIIKSYTDNTNNSIYNIALSQKRGESVAAYFAAKGVSSKLISDLYFGEDKPIAENNSDNGKQQNRRAQILISYRHKTLATHLSDTPLVSKQTSDDTIINAGGGIQIITSSAYNKRLLQCCFIRGKSYSKSPTVYDLEKAESPLSDSVGLLVLFSELQISKHPDCLDRDTCFDPPVRVLIPIPTQVQKDLNLNNIVGLYDTDLPGKWARINDVDGVTKVNGKFYYEFYWACPSPYQFRCGSWAVHCDTDIIIKAPKQYTLAAVKIYFESTWRIRRGEVKTGLGKNEKSLCVCYADKDGSYVALLIKANGDTIKIPLTPMHKMGARKAVYRTHRRSDIDKTPKIPPNKLYTHYRIRRKTIRKALRHPNRQTHGLTI